MVPFRKIGFLKANELSVFFPSFLPLSFSLSLSLFLEIWFFLINLDWSKVLSLLDWLLSKWTANFSWETKTLSIHWLLCSITFHHLSRNFSPFKNVLSSFSKKKFQERLDALISSEISLSWTFVWPPRHTRQIIFWRANIACFFPFGSSNSKNVTKMFHFKTSLDTEQTIINEIVRFLFLMQTRTISYQTLPTRVKWICDVNLVAF